MSDLPASDIDAFFELRSKILAHFRFEEGWAIRPIVDARDVYWSVDPGGNTIRYSDDRERLETWLRYVRAEQDGEEYGTDEEFFAVEDTSAILRGGHRAGEFTLVEVDTECDNNIVLEVLTSANEVP